MTAQRRYADPSVGPVARAALSPRPWQVRERSGGRPESHVARWLEPGTAEEGYRGETVCGKAFGGDTGVFVTRLVHAGPHVVLGPRDEFQAGRATCAACRREAPRALAAAKAAVVTAEEIMDVLEGRR